MGETDNLQYFVEGRRIRSFEDEREQLVREKRFRISWCIKFWLWGYGSGCWIMVQRPSRSVAVCDRYTLSTISSRGPFENQWEQLCQGLNLRVRGVGVGGGSGGGGGDWGGVGVGLG